MEKTYVIYEGKKYNTIADAVRATPDEVETADIEIYDIDGYHMTETLERNRHSGDFEYVSYYILTADGEYDVLETELNTEAEAIQIAEQLKAEKGYEKLIVQPTLGTVWETEGSCGNDIEV